MGAALRQSPRIFINERSFEWGRDQAAIVATVSRYFSDYNGNGFYPHPDEVMLQRELLALPALQQLQRMLRQGGARGMAITGLGLAGLDEPQRNAVLYAIALSLGFPTSTDQRTQRVAWDIRARPGSAGESRFVTFSERVGNADMHTDSSFYPMPEEQFLLYVVRAAQCGGGASLLIDVDDIHAELLRTEAGRASFDLLRCRSACRRCMRPATRRWKSNWRRCSSRWAMHWRSAGATIPSSRAWRRGRTSTRRRWARRWRC